jgi:hypothetical protein
MSENSLERSQRKPHLLQNTQSMLLKTVKVIKNEGRLRNCHSQEEPEET